MSRLSITALSARMLRWPAVMTSALLALSAQMVAVPPASEMVVEPPPAGAGVGWLLGAGVLPWAFGWGCVVGWRLSSAAIVALEPLELLLVPDICPLSRVARSSASEKRR